MITVDWSVGSDVRAPTCHRLSNAALATDTPRGVAQHPEAVFRFWCFGVAVTARLLVRTCVVGHEAGIGVVMGSEDGGPKQRG